MKTGPEVRDRVRLEPAERYDRRAFGVPPREEPRTEPFFPDFLFKEALIALLAFVVLMLIVAYVKPPMEAMADPTDTSYAPRPEWYFLFLFELLKYFPGSLEPVATVVMPGSFIVALLLLPFFDRSPERRPSRRPVAVAFAVGTLALAAGLTYMSIRSAPPPSKAEAAATTQKLSPVEAAGLALFKASKCDACHTINGAGGKTGPDLSHVGATQTMDWLHSYIENPKALNPNATMPPFMGKMSHQDMDQIARYLATLK